MPNIKSAKKRVIVTETKTLQNKMFKSAYKTAVKKYQAAVAAATLLLLRKPTRLLSRRSTRLLLATSFTRMLLPARRASSQRFSTKCNNSRT